MPKETSEKLSEYYNCIQCGQCCHFFEMIVNPQDINFDNPYDDLAVIHEFKKRLNVDFDEIQQCSIRLNATCSHLDKKTGLCLIHDKRPDICKNHFCQRYPKIEDEE